MSHSKLKTPFTTLTTSLPVAAHNAQTNPKATKDANDTNAKNLTTATTITPATPPHPLRDSFDIAHYLPPPPTTPFYVRKRIAILGAPAVGKSAVAIRCALSKFEAEYMPTFEDTFLWTTIVDNIHYQILLVDTQGHNEYSYFGQQYTIGIDGYILVFSVRDLDSFQTAKQLRTDLLDTLNASATKGTAEIPLILVGNQVDCQSRQVSTEIAQNFADEYAIPYFETSAYTAQNVTNVFVHILRIIQQNTHCSYTPLDTKPKSNTSASNSKKQPQQNSCLVQ